jgi:uncharacterized iron-regulated membrane protein
MLIFCIAAALLVLAVLSCIWLRWRRDRAWLRAANGE